MRVDVAESSEQPSHVALDLCRGHQMEVILPPDTHSTKEREKTKKKQFSRTSDKGHTKDTIEKTSL